jgi:hypothetical protein
MSGPRWLISHVAFVHLPIRVFYRGFRIMALDGSCMDADDEQANAEYFGYQGASRGQSAFPQARGVLGPVECGTHAVVAASIAPYSRGEQAMAGELLAAKLTPDMPVLGDRNFYGFKLWRIACAGGAKLVWRVQSQPQAGGAHHAGRWLVPQKRLRQHRSCPRCGTAHAGDRGNGSGADAQTGERLAHFRDVVHAFTLTTARSIAPLGRLRAAERLLGS